MPLTRFPDHEDKRVFLSTVLSFNLPPADGAHPDRLSIAVLWIDRDSPAALELSADFAMELLEHGALGLVFGGTGAEAAAALFEQAIEDGEFVRGPDEEISMWVDHEATLEEVLWTAAEQAMLPDTYADQPWDITCWARSGDPAIGRLRDVLGRLSAIVDDRYELGGEEE
jgi:hypothetical protein